MAEFLGRFKSLPGGSSSSSCHTVSLSAEKLRSNYAPSLCRLDGESGTPIVAPLDTLEQVINSCYVLFKYSS